LNIFLCHLPQTIAGAACGVFTGADGGGLHLIKYGGAFVGGSHCAGRASRQR
jgi:hypothetical protein